MPTITTGMTNILIFIVLPIIVVLTIAIYIIVEYKKDPERFKNSIPDLSSDGKKMMGTLISAYAGAIILAWLISSLFSIAWAPTTKILVGIVQLIVVTWAVLKSSVLVNREEHPFKIGNPQSHLQKIIQIGLGIAYLALSLSASTDIYAYNRFHYDSLANLVFYTSLSITWLTISLANAYTITNGILHYATVTKWENITSYQLEKTTIYKWNAQHYYRLTFTVKHKMFMKVNIPEDRKKQLELLLQKYVGEGD